MNRITRTRKIKQRRISNANFKIYLKNSFDEIEKEHKKANLIFNIVSIICMISIVAFAIYGCLYLIH
jgi:hypothetical protein